MGIFDFIKKQFIDIVEWADSEDKVLVYQFPMIDNEIQNGAQLVVREGQQATFFNEGKLADTFQAGTYTLNTNTLPILTSLKNWDKLFQSPFKSDVFFFNLREQLDLKWGTQTPITIRDKDFGVIRLKAFGNYSFRLSDPVNFWKNISGVNKVYTTENIEGQLRSVIVTKFASFFGNSSIPFIDMAANQDIFSDKLKKEIETSFKDLGLELTKFYVQSLSLPEELQSHLDKVSSMNMVGDLKRYAAFQASDSLTISAQNGGTGSVGAEMAAAMSMGQVMFNNLSNNNSLGTQNAQTSSNTTNAYADLEKLGDLFKKGILTEEEFNKKKAELLSKI